MAQQPITKGDITVDKAKVPAFAPATEVHLPEGPGPGSLNINRNAFSAYTPPPPTEAPTQVQVEQGYSGRMLPLGGCPHPVPNRWAADDLDIEGCTRCGLAQMFRPGQGLSWEQNDDWTVAARRAGVTVPS